MCHLHLCVELNTMLDFWHRGFGARVLSYAGFGMQDLACRILPCGIMYCGLHGHIRVINKNTSHVNVVLWYKFLRIRLGDRIFSYEIPNDWKLDSGILSDWVQTMIKPVINGDQIPLLGIQSLRLNSVWIWSIGFQSQCHPLTHGSRVIAYLIFLLKHLKEQKASSLVEQILNSLPGSRKYFISTIPQILELESAHAKQFFKLWLLRNDSLTFDLKHLVKSIKVESGMQLSFFAMSCLNERRISVSLFPANLKWCTGFDQTWLMSPISLPGVKTYISGSHRSRIFLKKMKPN